MKLAIPKARRETILKQMHDDATVGHMGIAARIFWWAKLHYDVRRYVESCERCAKMKPRSNISPVPLQPLQTVHKFERCQWDHVGPIKCEDKKDAHILVMTECPTSYTITAVVADTSAETSARTFFDKLVCTFGCPAVIQGDNNAVLWRNFSRSWK